MPDEREGFAPEPELDLGLLPAPADSAYDDPTVWIIRNPSGSPHAVFASEQAAADWIRDNPVGLEDAHADAWHLHGAKEAAAATAEITSRRDDQIAEQAAIISRVRDYARSAPDHVRLALMQILSGLPEREEPS